MKHRWSPTAALVGVLIAVELGVISDVEPTLLVGIMCPPLVMIGALLRLFHADLIATWAILVFIALSAAGNAFWYMLIIETVRLIFERLKS
jgi:hypothetical protein